MQAVQPPVNERRVHLVSLVYNPYSVYTLAILHRLLYQECRQVLLPVLHSSVDEVASRLVFCYRALVSIVGVA